MPGDVKRRRKSDAMDRAATKRVEKPARQLDAYRHHCAKFAEARGWPVDEVFGIWEQVSLAVEFHVPHLTRPQAERFAFRLVRESLDKQGAVPD